MAAGNGSGRPVSARLRFITGANVVDVEHGTIWPGRTIAFDGDEITDVDAPSPSPGAEVLDVAGAYVAPGMISCHTHLSATYPHSATDPGEYPAATALRATSRARDALSSGITTLRCVHEQHRADLWLRDARDKGWLELPRIYGAGRAITTPHGHGAGMACVEASGEQAFYEAACEELRAGADHVKIFITGGLAKAGEDLSAAEMTDGELDGTVRAASEHHTYVVAHSGASVPIRQALGRGVRCFEHAYELDEDTAALLAASGAFLTPTLIVTNCEPWMRANHFDQATIDNAAVAAVGHRASIRRAVAAGIPILAGTDLPPAADVGGVSATVRELQLLEEAGCSRLQALQAASVTPARLLGCSGWLGAIRPGYRADVVVLEENPLDDLVAMAAVRTVIQDGRVVGPAAR